MRTPAKRRPHFVSPTNALLDRARQEREVHGAVRCPAAPWPEADSWALATAQTCGWKRGNTAIQMVERRLATTGWTWRWEEDDLVLGILGWSPPAPCIVAIQLGLFEQIRPNQVLQG